MTPIPNPRDLAKYESVHEGFGDRMVAMAEREQRFRHLSAFVGQMLGVVVALAFLGASTYLIATGHDLAGGVLGTIDIVALVTIFVAGRSGRSAIDKSPPIASEALEV